MRERQHSSVHSLAKRPVRLTRRRFLGLAAGVGAGMTAVGWMASRSPVSSGPTPSPSLSSVARPAIVSRADWGALPVDVSARNEHGYYEKISNPEGWYVYPDDLRDSYQTVVIHHSAFYLGDGSSTLMEVQRLHREDRAWADIAYHFMADKDGIIYEGRDLSARGAHTQGHNTGSVGLCLLGDFRFEAPPSAQLQAVTALNRWLAWRLRLTHLAGHRQFNDWTVCPGIHVSSQLENLARLAGLQFGTDGYKAAARVTDGCGCYSHI